GSQVTLTATPAAGSIVYGWQGACPGTAVTACTFPATPGLHVTVTFRRVSWLTIENPGGGVVASSASGIHCEDGWGCSKAFLVGTIVTLSAAANSGSRFAGWGGACGG